MRTIIEFFCGLFFLLAEAFAGIGMITSSIDVRNVMDYQTAVVDEMEQSNFSPAVVDACGRQGYKYGYTVNFVLYHDDGTTTSVTYTDDTVTAGDTSDVYLAQVTTDYDYQIKIFNSLVTHELRNHAISFR